MKHILSSQQFDRPALEDLFSKTDEIAHLYETAQGKLALGKLCERKLLYAVFYEPSTRTIYSFCSAAHYLGMAWIPTVDARTYSSVAKGESLKDTIRTLCEFGPDVIVLRHSEMGQAERAAETINRYAYNVPIVNAGDGIGEHPTQALLDLYTILRELGRIDGLTVAVGGDLANGRTARSLVKLLVKFKDINFRFLSPANLKMRSDIIDLLLEQRIPFRETENIEEALTDADVAYWTRVQAERGSVNTTLNLSIGPREMTYLKQKSILMHPLPRLDEISTLVDQDERAAYFRQVKNGMLIRMALLRQLCAPLAENIQKT